jgi:hypothetical protein
MSLVMFGSFGAPFLCGTVTAMTYLNVLQLYVLLQLEDNKPNMVFQKYGLPPTLWSYYVKIS